MGCIPLWFIFSGFLRIANFKIEWIFQHERTNESFIRSNLFVTRVICNETISFSLFEKTFPSVFLEKKKKEKRERLKYDYKGERSFFCSALRQSSWDLTIHFVRGLYRGFSENLSRKFHLSDRFRNCYTVVLAYTLSKLYFQTNYFVRRCCRYWIFKFSKKIS